MGAFALALLLQDPIGDFLRRLRDDDPAARDAAASAILERWKAWTPADLDALRAAAADPDVEVAARARQTALRIDIRRRLGEAAFAELPGVDDVLARGSPERRIAAIKEVAILVELGRVPEAPLHALARLAAEQRWTLPAGPALEIADAMPRPLAPLAAVALADPDPAHVKKAVQLLGRARAVEYYDRLPPLLANADFRTDVAAALGHADARAHAPGVAKLMRAEAEGTRAAAAEVLGRMGAAEHAEAVASLLKSGDSDTLRLCAEALGRMGARERAEGVEKLLSHEDGYVRAEAAKALGRMRTGAARLVPLLRDRESQVKFAAAESLAAIGDASVVPALAALLREKDTSLLGFSAQILGRLGAKDRADEISALLLHNQPWTRAQAARALARLGSLKHLDLLIDLVDDEWDLVRTTSAIALGEMADLEWPKDRRAEAAKRLRAVALKDPAGEARIAAASAALRLEGTDAALELKLLENVNPEDADAPGALLDTLARLREPEGRSKLDLEIVLAEPVVSSSSLEAAAARAGLTLKVPDDLPLWGRIPAGPTTVRRLIAAYWGLTPYVEGSTLKLLPLTDALTAWRDHPRKK